MDQTTTKQYARAVLKHLVKLPALSAALLNLLVMFMILDIFTSSIDLWLMLDSKNQIASLL